MSTQDKFTYLISGIAILLFSASLLGWALKRRMSGESSRAVIDNLNARVRAWWVMVAIFAVSFLLGKIATIVLFGLVSFFALREFLSLTPTRPGDHRALSISFFVVLPVQYWLIGTEWYGLFSIFIPVYAFLLLPAFSVLTPDVDGFLERSAKIQWGVMLAVYCISHVPALLLLDIPGYEGGNALLLFYLLLVVQMSDVLQYVSGKLLGKRKIAPLVSPGKPVEGFVGGGTRCHWHWHRHVVDHSFLAPAGRRHVRSCRAHGLSRRLSPVRSQTEPRCQRLGDHDPRPRRHDGPHGFNLLRCADLLPLYATVVRAVT